MHTDFAPAIIDHYTEYLGYDLKFFIYTGLMNDNSSNPKKPEFIDFESCKYEPFYIPDEETKYFYDTVKGVEIYIKTKTGNSFKLTIINDNRKWNKADNSDGCCLPTGASYKMKLEVNEKPVNISDKFLSLNRMVKLISTIQLLPEIKPEDMSAEWIIKGPANSIFNRVQQLFSSLAHATVPNGKEELKKNYSRDEF